MLPLFSLFCSKLLLPILFMFCTIFCQSTVPLIYTIDYPLEQVLKKLFCNYFIQNETLQVQRREHLLIYESFTSGSIIFPYVPEWQTHGLSNTHVFRSRLQERKGGSPRQFQSFDHGRGIDSCYTWKFSNPKFQNTNEMQSFLLNALVLVVSSENMAGNGGQ